MQSSLVLAQSLIGAMLAVRTRAFVARTARISARPLCSVEDKIAAIGYELPPLSTPRGAQARPSGRVLAIIFKRTTPAVQRCNLFEFNASGPTPQSCRV